MWSDLIRKNAFTSAQPHDSQLLDELLSADETTVFGDSAYSNKKDKQEARKNGVYYGILDKGARKHKLWSTQKKNNTKEIENTSKGGASFCLYGRETKLQKHSSKNDRTP